MIKFISQNKYLLIVLLLTIFSGFIRLYRLTDVYSILNRDEAALGYNALILKTIGMDEWGRR